MNETMHICLAIHDGTGKYTKYAAVTMLSLLENTRRPVHFHILCDDSIGKDQKAKLGDMLHLYPAEVTYHLVDVSDLAAAKESYQRITIGTMFRLHLFDALKDVDTDRVIQIDCDLVVHTDIAALWDMDLQGKIVAGCVDNSPSRKIIVEKKIVTEDEYINAGVLVWDLKAIRELGIDFYKQSNDFFRRVPTVRLPDEEAVNVIFKGKIAHFDNRYNYMSVWTRITEEKIDHKIYHFAADVPRYSDSFMVDRLFRQMLANTPWWTVDFVQKLELAKLHRKYNKEKIITCLHAALKNRSHKIFWGIGGEIHPFIINCDMLLLKDGDLFVDSNPATWEKIHMGLKVISPKELLDMDLQDTSIISTIFRYQEVKKQLEKINLRENIDFFDGKALLDDLLMAKHFGERVSPWDV